MTFCGSGLITEPLKAIDAMKSIRAERKKEVGIVYAEVHARKDPNAMIKTLEAINEAIRNPKHPFRKTDSHPKKAVKNRYERRKIREYLHLTDWLSEETI